MEELGASVLGDPAFGDVHMAEDLEPGNDRIKQVPREQHAVMERAVDAVADPAPPGVRSHMDVGGVLADARDDDLIDQADERRLRRIDVFALQSAVRLEHEAALLDERLDLLRDFKGIILGLRLAGVGMGQREDPEQVLPGDESAAEQDRAQELSALFLLL